MAFIDWMKNHITTESTVFFAEKIHLSRSVWLVGWLVGCMWEIQDYKCEVGGYTCKVVWAFDIYDWLYSYLQWIAALPSGQQLSTTFQM